MNKCKTSAQYLQGVILTILLVLLDQLTKYLAVLNLKDQEAFVILPGIFEFHYLENQSAAFSIDPVSLIHKIFHISYFDQNPDAFLQAKMIFFIVMTLIVIALLALIYKKIPQTRHFTLMNGILIAFISGAIGNLIDRILNNYVVDFLYFSLIDFPIFNVADIYVTCAAFGVIFSGIFCYKEEDFELIFGRTSEH